MSLCVCCQWCVVQCQHCPSVVAVLPQYYPQYRPSAHPVLVQYLHSIDPVLPQYCPSTAPVPFPVLPQYCPSTPTVLSQYSHSTAPVLPTILPQHCSKTATVLHQYCPSIGPWFPIVQCPWVGNVHRLLLISHHPLVVGLSRISQFLHFLKLAMCTGWCLSVTTHWCLGSPGFLNFCIFRNWQCAQASAYQS